jgi:adenosylmethionine-8-amino-7-oxononanoate aminotransferase
MIFAFEVESVRENFARWWFREALARELLVRPIGRTVYFMPPYIVTDDEMQMLATRTLELLELA